MSYIPNVRDPYERNRFTGEITDRENAYYEGNLKEPLHQELLAGYDFCAEVTVSSFFYNLDIYKNEFEDYPNPAQLERKYPGLLEKLEECLQDWIERDRDELVVAMLDNEPDE